jgi:1-acyl-sn-glycerol-3-phosphate acyltransferase
MEFKEYAMRPWTYEPAPDLDQPLAERLRHFPREPDMTVYLLRSLAALTMRGWLRVYHRLQIMGLENLPSDGSFILVANHSSHLDTLCLLAALPLRKLHRAFPAAAKDYFFVSVPRLALAAVIVNALPFERQTHIRHSLDLCRQLLSNPGNILILFPEGTRTITGEVGEFRSGIGLIVGGTSIPVVPCFLTGTFQAWCKGKILPCPTAVRLRIGTPRTFEKFEPGKDAAQQISQELREAVLGLAQ